MTITVTIVGAGHGSFRLRRAVVSETCTTYT